ncbi:MAG: hypothetical protein ABR907_04505 [Terracidiphilus sp.]
MGFAQTCDTRSRRSPSRGKTQHSHRPVSPTDRANSPDGSLTERPSFAEDFLLEHSHAHVQITLVGLAASSEAAPKAMQHSAQSYGFPS